jgi:CubicO group peptidase (beta-lactamase class C family)
VDRGEVPGLVALVSWRGAVHVDAIGLKTRGRDDPIQRDSIFRISSMTKPITVRDLLTFRMGFGQMVRRATRTPTASRQLLFPRCRRNRPRPRSAAAYR